MLQLIKTEIHLDKSINVLQQELIDDGFPSLMDYNVELGNFSSTRTAHVITGWEERKLKAFLDKHPAACIYNTLSHNPDSGDQIIIDGEPYIDQFGLHVYINSQVSWSYHEDVDQRFNNNTYPYEELGLELYDYFNR